MATVAQSKAALDALYADNTAGDISPEDLRQLVATVLPPYTAVTGATHAVLDSDMVILVDYAGAVTVTLQTDQVWDGRQLVVQDASGDASTYNITIDTQASETVNGAASATISADYGALTFYCDGTNWFAR